MSATTEYDPYALPDDAIQEPPTSLWAALRKIGPGIILAGTIVGSGELLLTTKLGAESGLVFLWLILYSCIIKVFVQTELGRYAISSGKPTLGAINELQGPRFGAHWILWCWLFMMLATTMQLGAMTGTVGQCFNLAFPKVSLSIRNGLLPSLAEPWRLLDEETARVDAQRGAWEKSVQPTEVPEAIATILKIPFNKRSTKQHNALATHYRQTHPGWKALYEDVQKRGTASSGVAAMIALSVRERPELPWAGLTCLTALILLWSGSYRRIEIVTTALVVSITLSTVTAALLLPFTPFPIHWDQVAHGMTIQIPTKAAEITAAFAVFGITGVGASELFYYPYWCLEKGYARYAGRRNDSPEWERRAKGWIRVMHLDAWVSMVVFTVSTVSFYLMGASVLYPQGLRPEGVSMIATLSRMFVDTFGTWTELAFLVGAGAVLFKTLYLSAAGNGRLTADFASLTGAVKYGSSTQRSKVIQGIALGIPVLALFLFCIFKEPGSMVVVGGFAQALTLPIISGVTIYFRYRKLDRRIRPALVLDILLWLAFVSISIVACYAMWDTGSKFLFPAPK